MPQCTVRPGEREAERARERKRERERETLVLDHDSHWLSYATVSLVAIRATSNHLPSEDETQSPCQTDPMVLYSGFRVDGAIMHKGCVCFLLFFIGPYAPTFL